MNTKTDNFMRKENNEPLCSECAHYRVCENCELPEEECELCCHYRACDDCKHGWVLKSDKILNYARELGFDKVKIRPEIGVIQIFMY